MQEGLGWMYIGFHLDPLLRVHWNNLAPPLKFRISTPEGITVALAEASARKIEVESDADPHEFLLGIEWILTCSGGILACIITRPRSRVLPMSRERLV